MPGITIVASLQINDQNVRGVYGEVLRITGNLPAPYLDPFRMKLIRQVDLLFKAAVVLANIFQVPWFAYDEHFLTALAPIRFLCVKRLFGIRRIWESPPRRLLCFPERLHIRETPNRVVRQFSQLSLGPLVDFPAGD